MSHMSVLGACWHQAKVERRMIMRNKACKNRSNDWRKNNMRACKKACTRKMTVGGRTTCVHGRKT
jgi:hypothetical protein